MKHTGRLIALLLALALILALPAMAAFPKETGALAADYTGKTVILQTNDVHGAIDGYAKVAQLKKDLQARGAEVYLVDSGDFSQGSIYIADSEGAAAIALMNAAGYDLATLGNHEFDYGSERLLANLGNAQFKTISANVKKDGKQMLDSAYVIETDAGLKLGFFGLDTPETKSKADPSRVRDIAVPGNTNGETALYDCAAAETAALREAGADLVIGMWHLGVYDESSVDGHRSLDVLAHTPGIDLVLDAHSHTEMTSGANGEPVLSTGTGLVNIGVVVIDNETKKIEQCFLLPTEGLAADPDVAALADAIRAEVDEKYSAAFAESRVELNGAKGPNGNRDSETNNGDITTDALRWYALEKCELDVPEENVVAIFNGGGIRAPISIGEITMGDILNVHPFGNTVTVAYVSGETLLETLEASTFCTPSMIGGYPQTGGFLWTVNTTKAYDAQTETYPSSTYHGPASIQRVTIQSVNGEAFDPAATYAVVTSDFCTGGGDTYYAMTGAERIFNTGIAVDAVIVAYIREALNGVITEQYAAPRGDVTFITMENTVVLPTTQRLIVFGEEQRAEAYNINGENYFKLRDIAMLLRGSEAQFALDYDAATRTVSAETGGIYTPDGSELVEHADRSASIVRSNQKLVVDGEEKNLTAFNLEGNNFVRLSDLGRVLGFEVEYDEDARTMNITASAAEQAA